MLLLLVASCSGVRSGSAAVDCPGEEVSTGPGLVEWQTHANGTSITVEWGYGNVSVPFN